MPKVGKEWRFKIVDARIKLGECGDERPALELYILDDERRLLVPISGQGDMYDPRKHLVIDRLDPDFSETGLSAEKNSFILENEAKPEDAAVIRRERGWLVGAAAERYVIWSGRSKDKRVIRGQNPALSIPRMLMPWRDEPNMYKDLTKKSKKIKLGRADYDVDTQRVLVAPEMWPDWYWWVFARAQQAWDIDLSGRERNEWVESCRAHQRAASELLETWIGIRRKSLDIADANRQAQVAFMEACVLVYVHDSGQYYLNRQMEKLVNKLGSRIFWR